ncbi:MAG: Adaptive-response sensory-kinase SasA [Chroococcopsis gigantea SAG 12.99]|jgi:PAS domain S-box-containing protein|nr:PAS domain S-box protein [Chlorogloea purpurea SAG 13.99]MDV2999425.1 Adaptive-response sensory-kinase SasA [Chroococcopsis gigantea SAG 12.99]
MVEMPLNNEIEQRFGVLPNFFLLASDTPEITANLWGFAKSAYLDNPLPSLFKERLFVYLSHLCEVPYCIARHIGFLVGLGYPSGDRQCRSQTVEQVLPLLKRPLPRGEALEATISLGVASLPASFEFPNPDTAEEEAIFACATHVFLQTPDAPRAIIALRQVFSSAGLEFLNLFLAFVRMAHYWTESHPELRFEDDINQLLATNETLAACLLNDLEVKDDALNQQVLEELAELRVKDITDRKQAEALLRASYDTFRHLVENSPFGVYVVDADFRLAQVSAGAQKVFENVRPLIGRDFAETLRLIWTEPFASEAIALFRHTLETGEPYHAPSMTERRQDILDTESYDWKIERITLPDGRFGVVCHFYDLSERQRYEAALRESEEQFRHLADSSPVLIWETDETGVIFVNRYYLEFFGRALDDVRGMGWANFLHPDDAAAYVGAYRAAFERQKRYEFQCRFLRHDGDYRWLQNVGEPHYGLDRTFLGFVGCSVDVTDIKAVEVELQASEERFRNMADNAPMMVWVTDTTAYCTYLSRSWYDFTGQTEETGLGFGWLDVTHPDDRESAQAIFLAANGRQEAFQLEYRLWHRDGRYRTCIDAAKPWFSGDGKFKGYIGSVIDIDDRKQAELQLRQQASELIQLNKALEETSSQLSERNQELDRFVYTVSHDLKAPLRAIANLSQWLCDDLKEQLEAEYQYQLELLQSRVSRMEAMIEGLLAYSRVGRIEVPTEKVDVGELLAEILDSLMPPPSFIISIQSEMPTLVARRLLLSQVFSNLIGNAIKHCDRPDGRLQITATRKGEYYEFSLADNGVGIAPENHERVFKIFHTLKGRNGQESTGIGLSIVKKIIESEGGSLMLESDLGEGATFRFTYPIVPQ